MTVGRTPPPPLLSVDQAARRLGVSRRTVQAWVSGSKLAVIRLSPRCLRIDPADLAAFVEARRQGGLTG